MSLKFITPSDLDTMDAEKYICIILAISRWPLFCLYRNSAFSICARSHSIA